MHNKKVGFLTRALSDATGGEMWKGIIEGSRNADVPLFTFRGGLLNKDPNSILYHLFRPSDYDGIITWASSDAEKSNVDYYDSIGSVPLLCMSFQIPGRPVVLTDCQKGMMELTDHFIETHGCRKIVFVRGPETHVYAKERYEGYLASLKKHSIDADQNLITPPGGWALADGEKAADLLLKKRSMVPGEDFDAVLCVGDNVAIGLLEAFQREGIKVPNDIKIGGFNGIDVARCCNPPLSTVEMPFKSSGLKSFSILQSMIDGENAAQVTRYSAPVLLGQSCGCMSVSLQKAAACNSSYTGNLHSDEKRPMFFKKYIPVSKDYLEGLSFQEIQQWRTDTIIAILQVLESDYKSRQHIDSFFAREIPPLFDIFHSELAADSKTRFLEKLSYLFDKVLVLEIGISVWQDVISEMRITSLPYLRKAMMQKEAENLWQQARVMISEIDARTRQYESIKNERLQTTLRIIGAALMTSYDVSDLMNILTGSIHKLGIPSLYVALYENSKYTPENKLVPEKSRLSAAVRDGIRVPLPPEGRLFDTRDIVPGDLLPHNRYYSMIVESLHFQDVFIGYIVCETGPEDGSVYQALRDQLSSSLFGALLLSDRQKVKKVLETTLQSMTDKADVVSGHSEKISDNVKSISTSMEEVAASIRETSVHIKNILEIITAAESLVGNARATVEQLTESTQKIASSVSMISDIAEKTNVLALNAAIEAAHAGEAGRGFSVVAKAVKELAAQTVASTQQIEEVVAKNFEDTSRTRDVIMKTNASIKKISDFSSSIMETITEQVSATSEISGLLINASSGSSEIYKAIAEIAKLGDNLQI